MFRLHYVHTFAKLLSLKRAISSIFMSLILLSQVWAQDNTAPIARCTGSPALNAYNDSYNSLDILLENNPVWQSFTAEQTGLLSRVDILLRMYATDLNTTLLDVEIYEGEGESGSLLFNTTVLRPIVPRTYSWINLFSDESINVIAGNKYTVRVTNKDYELGDLSWAENLNNPYSGGRNRWSTGRDYAFRTFIHDPSPLVIELDGNGTATVSVNEIDNGSSDNSGTVDLSLDKSSFDCSEIGDNIITLTVTDNSGNSSTCETTLNVQDNLLPIINCVVTDQRNADERQDFYTVQGAEFDAIFSDNCSEVSITNDYNNTNSLAGEQLRVGVHTITWTGTDQLGNITQCITNLTVNYPEDTYFITSWQTNNDGTSCNTCITIPTFSGETYDYDVDWNNDGIFDEFGFTGSVTHNFGTIGTKTIRIRGQFPRIYFNGGGDMKKILTVEQWGDISWTSMGSAFRGCENLEVYASDTPDLSNVTDMSSAFRMLATGGGARNSFKGNLSNWDVSNVRNMSYTFYGCADVGNLGSWRVGNVTDMSGMFFLYGGPFIGNLSSWDVSKVTNMANLFIGCYYLNIIGISNWKVDNVTNMRGMFSATEFNGDLSLWDVSNVADMYQMFAGSLEFEGHGLRNWNITNVTNMQWMFRDAEVFDQNLGGWQISATANMSGMFDRSGMSVANYDQTLIGWESQGVSGITLGAENLQYCAGEGARSSLINNYGWTITGDALQPNCLSPNDFVTTWQTTTANESITIPTTGDGYNYDIDWDNDGVFDETGITGNATHVYPTAGTHTVRIRGQFPRIYFNGGGDKDKILSVEQWGDIAWTSMGRAFKQCFNLEIFAADVPDLSNVTDMSSIFAMGTHPIYSNFRGDLSNWDVSNVTNMSYAFQSCSNFGNLSSWEVDNVVNMSGMFFKSGGELGDLRNWNVSRVINMSLMFVHFTGTMTGLSNWNVSNVMDMSFMFNITSFDANLGSWNIGSVTNMTGMFDQSAMSVANYDQTLIGWESQGVSGLTLGAQDLQYCNGAIAHESLINNYGWTIIGDQIQTPSCDSRAFVTTWRTTTANESITIPTFNGETYDYSIDWGDGTFESSQTGNPTHIYTNAGTHTVTITGQFPRIYFNNSGDRRKILSVEQWGNIEWSSMESAFEGCLELSIFAADTPDLSNVTDMRFAFAMPTSGNRNFNVDLSNWDVSNVTNMHGMFQGVNQTGDLSSWNVSNVTNMYGMFWLCSSDLGDLKDWQVANVRDMSNMFLSFSGTVEGLNNWIVSNVTNMQTMFYGSNFNGNISNWDVSSVTNMGGMFYSSNFNGNISNWDVSNVTNMLTMFKEASSFNQNLGAWNIGSVTNMADMLDQSGMSVSNYDQTLIGWESQGVSGLTLGAQDLQYCDGIAARTSLINNYGWTINGDQPVDIICSFRPFITTWDTRNTSAGSSCDRCISIPTAGSGYNYDVDWNNDGVFDEFGLTGDVSHEYENPGIYTIRIRGQFPRIYFNNNSNTDKDKIISIDQWGDIAWTRMDFAFYGCSNLTSNATDAPDLSQIDNLESAFHGAANFNGDLSGWNVSNVINMERMFMDASSFNSDLSSWDVSSVLSMSGMFSGASNFDQNLGSWNITSLFLGTMQNMLDNSGLSITNYDQTLIGWAARGASNISLGAQGLQYCEAEDERNTLINTYNWTITGDQFNPACMQIPMAVCQNITVDADANCEGIAIAANFDGGSSDPTGEALSFSLDNEGPFPLGTTDVVLTVTNESGLTDQCSASITVEDNTPPVVLCRDITVELDANGNGSYTNPMINNGSYDNCGFGLLATNRQFVSCDDIGTFPVTLELEDAAGNSASCIAQVTVIDNATTPACIVEPTAVCQNITVDADANCEGIAIATDFDGGSTDPRGETLSFSLDNAGPFPLGITNVTLTVTNESSLTAQCSASITVEDNTPPTAICQGVSVPADENGMATVFPADVDNGSFDACGPVNLSFGTDSEGNEITHLDVTCGTGGTLVVLLITDNSGNQSTCFTGIEVIDNTPPIANCKDITVELDANGNGEYTTQELNDGSTDNCALDPLQILIPIFVNCNDIGTFTETFFVKDASGNEASCTGQVTVVDNLAPVISCPTDGLRNSEDGQTFYTIQGTEFDATFSDNCAGASITNDYNNAATLAGEQLSGGTHFITWIATDASGNIAECSTTITVDYTESNYFITTWQTTTSNESITIPTYSREVYDYIIDWGDGVIEFNQTGDATHIYTNAGTHTVRIGGQFPRIYFNSGGDKDKIMTIEQWGDVAWTSMSGAFAGCSNLNITNPQIDTPDLSHVTDMRFMFYNATSFNGVIGGWDVGNVQIMNSLFRGASAFNQDIGDWKVDHVTDMLKMFFEARAFNQDISRWNTGNVERMELMFYYATSFNQPIGSWNVENVHNMRAMFEGAYSFNQDIGSWNIEKVENLSSMFKTTSFNQDISQWQPLSATNMKRMFEGNGAFDQNIGGWNVENVTNMALMFAEGGLSIENYDALLIGWSSQQVQPNVVFDAGNSQYCAGADAKSLLESTPNNWIITDAGTGTFIQTVNVLSTSVCDSWTNTYSQTLEIVYSDDVNTGSLIVNEVNFPVTGSPQTVELTNLTSDGQAVDVNVYWSEYTDCKLELLSAFTSPADCSLPCDIITVTADDPYNCNPNADTYSRDLLITYQGTNLTGSFMVSVDGGTPIAYPLAYQSPQTITLSGLPSDGKWVDIDVYISEASNCSWAGNKLFKNPQNCGSNPGGDCDITSLNVGEQRCDYEQGTFEQDLILSYENAPAYGSILVKVNGQSGWETFSITSSPQVLTLRDLDPDGKKVDIFLKFSDDNGCTFYANNLFTAPDGCTPPCAITAIAIGTQTACDPATNTYSQELMVIYENEPNSGNLIVAGQSFAITGSPQTVTLTNLPSDGNEVDVTAYFSANSSCGLTENALFTAPEACGTPPSGDGTILFVVKAVNNMHSGDALVKTQLETTGYTVIVKGQGVAKTSDATGKALVLISNTVSASAVNTKFTNVAVPVVSYERLLFDELGMTGSSNGSDHGQDSDEESIDIDLPSHTMAAGLIGETNVYHSEGSVIWGNPNNNAIKVASTQGWYGGQWAVFGYETGSNMVSGIAPARRASLFFKASQVSKLNANGWALFDAVICWATGCQNARFAPESTAQAPIPIKAFPNPFLNHLNIEWEGHAQEVQLTLRNLLGQEVISQKVWFEGRYQLPTAQLPEGIYILQMIGGGFKREVKVMKK